MKVLRLLFALIFCGIGSFGAAAAEPDLLFGQSHDYSVIMRGNGESIVYARINLTNNTDAKIEKYEFEIPNLDVAELTGHQVTMPRRCSLYDYGQPIAASKERPCLKYEESSVDLSYIPETAEFKKLSFSGDTVGKRVAVLPAVVEPGKSTVLVLSYIGKGYVKESLGVFTYNFETLKVPSRVKSARVAVDVDSDFVLEGQKSKVNYNNKEAFSQGAALDSANTADLRGTVQSIGRYGGVVKEAKNLASGETLLVKGKYAESAWRLNLGKMVLALVGFTAVIGALIWLMRKASGRRTAPSQASIAQSKVTSPAPKELPTSRTAILDPLCISAGLASAVLVFGATLGLNFYSKVAFSSYSYNPDPVFQIVVAILLILFYALAVLAPAIWVAASRRDWRAFIYVVIWEFTFLLVLVLIYQLGFRGLVEEPIGIGVDQPLINDCQNC